MDRSHGEKTGGRIRARRLDLGLRQADVAKQVGISASYLNLIEHDRRRIAGKLMADIAAVLQVEPTQLAHGAATELLDAMHTAAGRQHQAVETARTAELASRYPGWAQLIAAQSERISSLEAQVQAVNDRMTYDPTLAASLHEVISSVTSIRSTASILTGDEALDADWLRRFHKNVHEDAIRLAEHSEALVAYLGAPADAGPSLSPLQEATSWLAETDFHLAQLEGSGDPNALTQPKELSKAAASLINTYAKQYVIDAKAMPLKQFGKIARSENYDPAMIAGKFGVGVADAMRRLASLPAQDGHPPIGLVSCDGAGGLGIVKSVPGFTIPRGGDACPLWPLFTALGQPGRPIRAEVAFPGTPPTRLLCFAVATQTMAGFDAPAVVQSVMLVLPDPPEGLGPVLPIGPTCRICTRQNCAARREPMTDATGFG